MAVSDIERHDRGMLITIGQLADCAGVTVRAVRHYHQRGLLAEPARDASGYRRYGAHHAIELIRIKTLADAGVPLARIKELLTADTEQLAAAVSEIDGQLKERIASLTRARARLAKLTAGERLFVPGEVADYLDHLRALGVSDRTVRMERDGWLLLGAAAPEMTAAAFAQRRDDLNDPEFQSIYVEVERAFDWAPDDPRFQALVDRAVAWVIRRYGSDAEPWDITKPVTAQLVDAAVNSSPAVRRLKYLVYERLERHRNCTSGDRPDER